MVGDEVEEGGREARRLEVLAVRMVGEWMWEERGEGFEQVEGEVVGKLGSLLQGELGWACGM